MSTEPASDVWDALAKALGVSDVRDGQEVEIDGPTSLRAVVESAHADPPHSGEVLLHVGGPFAGLAHWFTLAMGGQTVISMRFHVYGDAPQGIADELEASWGAWFGERYPTPAQ